MAWDANLYIYLIQLNKIIWHKITRSIFCRVQHSVVCHGPGILSYVNQPCPKDNSLTQMTQTAVDPNDFMETEATTCNDYIPTKIWQSCQVANSAPARNLRHGKICRSTATFTYRFPYSYTCNMVIFQWETSLSCSRYNNPASAFCILWLHCTKKSL